jgi:hypothetical protein
MARGRIAASVEETGQDGSSRVPGHRPNERPFRRNLPCRARCYVFAGFAVVLAAGADDCGVAAGGAPYSGAGAP